MDKPEKSILDAPFPVIRRLPPEACPVCWGKGRKDVEYAPYVVARDVVCIHCGGTGQRSPYQAEQERRRRARRRA
jgi:hypothetical protein